MNAQCKTRPGGPSLEQLTDREREIVQLIAEHKTSKVIAAELGIHENTVNKAIASVRGKWLTSDRYETARLYTALSHGVGIHPPQILPRDEPAIPEPDRFSNLPDTAVFGLADVLAIEPRHTFEDPEPKGLKALDSRFGIAWRIAAILAGAVLIGMVLTWALLFANGITEMLSGSLRP